jgi:hypothetical protein
MFKAIASLLLTNAEKKVLAEYLKRKQRKENMKKYYNHK